MNHLILLAEIAGGDITPELAEENGIIIVPMRVSFLAEKPMMTDRSP